MTDQIVRPKTELGHINEWGGLEVELTPEQCGAISNGLAFAYAECSVPGREQWKDLATLFNLAGLAGSYRRELPSRFELPSPLEDHLTKRQIAERLSAYRVRCLAENSCEGFRLTLAGILADVCFLAGLDGDQVEQVLADDFATLGLDDPETFDGLLRRVNEVV